MNNKRYLYGLLPIIAAPIGLSQTIDYSSPVIVTGAGDKNNPQEDYIGRDTSSSTRLKLSAQETPQTLTQVTEKRIEEQSLKTIESVLIQSPGIVTQKFDGNRPVFYSRGFSVENFSIDNIPVFYDSTWGNGEHLSSAAKYEQVEVLKGASGLLNGIGNPSASVNLVRKRADSKEFTGSLTTGYGRFDQFAATADISSALNKSGSIRGRAVLNHDQTGSHIDIEHTENNLFYLTLEADLGVNTLFSFGASYQEAKDEGLMWGSREMFFSDGTPTNWDRSKTTAADWTFAERETLGLFAEIEHTFSNDWSLTARASYDDYQQDSRLLFLYGSLDKGTGQGLNAFPAYYKSFSESYNFDLFVNGKYNLFGRDHELVVGSTYTKRKFENNLYNVDSSTIGVIGNFYNWDGTGYALPDFDTDSIAFTYDDSTEKRLSNYLTTRLNITDDLKVVLGANFFSYNLENQGEKIEEHDFKFIPFAGALYDITDTTTAYVSYTKIFDPQSETDINYNKLDAKDGHSYEIGIKSSFLDNQLLTTASVFYTDLQNLAISQGFDANFIEYYAPVGATSKGFDIGLTGNLSDSWNVQVGYTYTQVEDNDGEAINTQIPDSVIKAYTTYNAPFLEGLTLGAGVNWQSAAFTVTDAGYKYEQDSYFLVNLLAKYQVNENLSVQLNIDNALDKEYATVFDFNQYMSGKPVNGLLSVNYNF